MSSTFNDVRAAIEGRIATEMALAPAYPVAFQNAPFTPPNNTPWVASFLRFGSNNYATLQPPTTGNRLTVKQALWLLMYLVLLVLGQVQT
jgi:hypothetical protein